MQEESVEKRKLFDAAETNDLKTVKFFFEETCIPTTIMNDDRQTVAHVAAKNGHLDIVMYMAQKNPSILSDKDRSQNTVYLWAIEKGALDIVKYLLEKHKEHTLPDFWAVQNAIQQGHLHILKYFIEEKKVDVNIRNKLDETPLFLAVESKHPHIIEYLIEEKKADLMTLDINRDNILYVTIAANNLPLMKRLWDEKKLPIKVDWQNRFNDTLLHKAAIFKRIETVKYLVDEKHAQLNIPGTERMTPLHCAACRDDYEICKFLIERGADARIIDEEEHLPWQKAFNTDLIEYLKSTAEARNRRSVTLPHLQLLPIARRADLPSGSAGYLDGVVPTAAPHYSFHSQSFLLFAEWMLKVTGLISEDRIFSYVQIQEDRIDQISGDAIEAIVTFEES